MEFFTHSAVRRYASPVVLSGAVFYSKLLEGGLAPEMGPILFISFSFSK